MLTSLGTTKPKDQNNHDLLLKQEKFEDIKGVIRFRTSKKDRQHND